MRLLATAVEKAKAEIAEADMSDCGDLFDIEAMEVSFTSELAGFDWTDAVG